MKFYFVHTSLSFAWISDFARWWETNAMGSPRWHALYTRTHAHTACACTRPRAPLEFNFQLDLSGRHCQEELSEPISYRSARTGSSRQPSRFFRFAFYDRARESERKREGDGTTIANKKNQWAREKSRCDYSI